MIRESGAVTNFYVYGLDFSGNLQGAGTIGGLLSAYLNGTTASYAYDANGNIEAEGSALKRTNSLQEVGRARCR